MPRDRLAALVNGLGNLLDVLASAAPQDKAEVYRKLGLQLTYDPARRVVTVESHLGPGGSGALPRGARPSGGPTSGAASADPVGESQCRRTELRLYPNNPDEHVLVGCGLNRLSEGGLYDRSVGGRKPS